jgi:dynein heavy chain
LYDYIPQYSPEYLIQSTTLSDSITFRYDDNEPENIPIPDYDTRIAEVPKIGPFLKLLLIRTFRMDRCMLMCKWFIRKIEEMGDKFVDPVTDTIESIYEGA